MKLTELDAMRLLLLSERVARLQAEQASFVSKLCLDYKVDPTKYYLDVASGEFVLVPMPESKDA